MNTDSNETKFPQSLLLHNYPNTQPQIQNNKLVLRVPPYSKEQIEFHTFIDRISIIMTPRFEGNPQLCRIQAQDSYEHIRKLGKFVNPVSKQCIFKNIGFFNINDTIVKLNLLRLSLTKYSMTKLPNENILQKHCYELCVYVETIIKYILKKDEARRASFYAESFLRDIDYFTEHNLKIFT